MEPTGRGSKQSRRGLVLVGKRLGGALSQLGRAGSHMGGVGSCHGGA